MCHICIEQICFYSLGPKAKVFKNMYRNPVGAGLKKVCTLYRNPVGA